MSVQSRAVESFPVASSAALSPYSKFKMGSEVKGGSKTISKSVERFLDFCRFEGADVEQKSLEFFRFTKNKSQYAVEDVIIRFVISQKERIDRNEITVGTLRNLH